MSVRDNLGIRMKENYEKISRTKLMRRTPVALRIDGKAFHTFTRGFAKPFDDVLVKCMQETTKYLCENIQGCVFGYTQSDEITLILIDYQTLTTSAWFDYEVQKICSISSSMATLKFNLEFGKILSNFNKFKNNGNENVVDYGEYYKALYSKGAMFDSRCFNIPKEEVCNLIFWRQIDAIRNSIQMVGRSYFSAKELDHKSQRDIQDMLHKQFNVNWNDYPTYLKRGSACIKTENGWIIDKDMPILKNEDRDYVEKLIYIDSEK